VNLPLNVSIRELLDRAVSQMTSTASYDRRQVPHPWPFTFMDLLTSSDHPHPFMLIVGENHIDEVHKYAYYYSSLLRKRCWYLCLESTPMASMLSMLSLASGVPRHDLLDLKVAPPHFAALNEGLAALYQTHCTFSLASPMDLTGLVSLAKTVKKQGGVEVLIIDALHRVEFEHGKVSTPTEQRWISQVLRAVAHAGELTVVAGFNRPGDSFADLPSDSTFFCELPEKEETDEGRLRRPKAALASPWRFLLSTLWGGHKKQQPNDR